MIIIIPTKNRSNYIFNSIEFLKNNTKYFSKIIVVDSSDIIEKEKVKKICSEANLNIKCIDEKPSTCIQRNTGLKQVVDSDYIMFMDDDNIFFEDSFEIMFSYIKNNSNDTIGFAFNQVFKEKKNLFDYLKKLKIVKFFGLYNAKIGSVSDSGWHTKIINLKQNTFVEWLPTRAVIYKFSAIKNLEFDEKFGIYGYLEDLDFSLTAKKNGKLVVVSNAKYTHDKEVERNSFGFGKQEIINRFLIVKKHNFKIKIFFIGSFIRTLISLLGLFKGNMNCFFRSIGNILGILICIFKK